MTRLAFVPRRARAPRPPLVHLAPIVAFLVLGLVAPGCANVVARRGDGLDVASLPAEQRADYALFAVRCSKCHSLSRPLDSGISSDEYWARYVEKMRLQPGSGISPEDSVNILRFLRYYAAQMRAKQASGASWVPSAPSERPKTGAEPLTRVSKG